MTARWRRWYRLGLRAFPAEFRNRWGAEMEETFSDRMAGLDPGAARRLALRELATLVASGLRERGTIGGGAPLLQARDLKHALRLLGRSPGFSLLTVLVLAGGLGLSTFTFSFLHTAMIKALPLAEGERIVRIDPMASGRVEPIDAADAAAFVGSLRSLVEVGGYGNRDLVVGRDGNRQVVDGAVVDPVLFSVARMPPLLGRTLIPADAAPGAEPVIVLSYRTWVLVFGADRELIDRPVVINDRPTRVVGVMPERFGFPVATEAWMALPTETYLTNTPGVASIRLAGRLAPGVTHEQAAAEASAVLRRVVSARVPGRLDSLAVSVESFPAMQFGEERVLTFSVLNLLAALILVLALVNVTNLLLARLNERSRETAVRLALGASTARLVIQGMWETVLLCLVGGILGTAAAAWGLDAITRWTRANMEGNLAFWWVWQMDTVTVLVAGGFVTLATAALGSVVARQALSTNVREVLSDGGIRGGSRREGRLSRTLVAIQVATVTVLMFFGAMSGVIARRVMNLDLGYDLTNLLHGAIAPPEGRYPSAEARAALYRKAHAALVAQGEFDRILLRRTLAEQHSPSGRFVTRGSGPDPVAPTAHQLAVLGDLSTSGVTIVEGRGFEVTDDPSRAPVALVSRSLAARWWRGRSPVGDQIRLAGVGDTTAWRTIVGVASDVVYGNPLSRDRGPDAVYLPLLQDDGPVAVVMARFRSTESAGRAALIEAVGEADPLLVPEGIQPFAGVVRKAGFIALSVSKLFAACFAFALFLAVVGTYGLMSRSIGLRRGEIGIRRALGASEAGVRVLLLRQAAGQLGRGALVAAPVLGVVGVGFSSYFPIGAGLTVGLAVGVSVAIVAVVLATTWIPTRRAARVGLRESLTGG